jgi:hypothetical protein
MYAHSTQKRLLLGVQRRKEHEAFPGQEQNKAKMKTGPKCMMLGQRIYQSNRASRTAECTSLAGTKERFGIFPSRPHSMVSRPPPSRLVEQ